MKLGLSISCRWLGVVVLLVICCPMLLWAQTTAGIISGTVMDDSGAVLPGVSITVSNTETGITHKTLSDDAGRYSVPQLPSGSYEVQADLSGFKTFVRSGITLTVGREAVVAIKLSVGDISERIVVSGEAPLVESTSSSMGGLVDDKKIRDLPLNGRNFVQLALLQTGVTYFNSGATAPDPLSGTGTKFSVNGSRPNGNNFMIDGVNLSDNGGSTPGSATGQNLGVEGILEFSVLTNTYSAAFGRNTGGIINIVSKSGTNAWHGSVFEFHRNSALDAKNFFDPHEKKIPHFVRNQFGFAVGGPIKTDKSFIFANYEGLRDRLGFTAVSAVPNALARQGLLPDPATGGLRDVGLNPRIVPYLKLYPLPNGRDFGDGTGELLSSISQPSDEDYAVARFDQQLSPLDSFFARYSFDDASVLTPNSLRAFANIFVSRMHMLTLQEKRILSPTLFNTATFGFNRSFMDLNTIALTPEAKDPSLSFIPGKPFGAIQLAAFSTASGTIPNMGTGNPYTSAYNTFQFIDDLRWTKGAHNIQVGAVVSRLQNNVSFPGVAGGYGVYVFPGSVQLLQGVPSLFQQVVPPSTRRADTGEVVTTDLMRGWRQTNLGFYIQDDIKVKPNFSLNLGLRHESMTTLREVNGRESLLVRETDAQVSIPHALINNPGKLAFEPRIGLAWDPFGDGKTAVRAGFGIFHDQITGYYYFGLGSVTYPWTVKLNINNPPFPNAYDLIAAGSSQAAPLILRNNFDLKYPAKIHFNLNIQRQLLADTTVTVAYVGSQSSQLYRTYLGNLAIPEIRADGSKFFPVGAPRVNPAFATMQTTGSDVNASYHAFQLSLNRRFSRGLQFQGSYTFSKSLDQGSQQKAGEGRNASPLTLDSTDVKREHGLSSWDVRNNFVFNFTYDLPLGAGMTGFAGLLARGWTLNSILTIADGSPFTVSGGVNRSRDLSARTDERPSLLPNRSNNPVLGGPDRYYDPTAFALAELGTYGNLARNTLIGPGLANLDFALNKTFFITEDRGIQFRAECFNVLNRPAFGLPNTTVFTSTGAIQGNVGRVTTTTLTSRQIQLGLKVIF